MRVSFAWLVTAMFSSMVVARPKRESGEGDQGVGWESRPMNQLGQNNRGNTSREIELADGNSVCRYMEEQTDSKSGTGEILKGENITVGISHAQVNTTEYEHSQVKGNGGDEPKEELQIVGAQKPQSPINEGRMPHEDNEITRFLQQLKSFVNETSFDVFEFERQLPSLRDELSDINFFIHMRPLTRPILDQLAFAKHMFHVMEDSIEHLQTYNIISGPGNRLAFKMTELNVRGLALHDSHGHPDVGVAGYADKVLRLWQDISDMRKMFENHIVEAELTITALMREVS
ncbi:hypothetical protein JCM33374_g6428 [Metschnikowia sp. JCM 33374]|nr:hypothetical protein JCM33374_g6428 [Metschnikowia sp. JCM 33374]